MNYYLPAKIRGYLLRLSHHYAEIPDKAKLKAILDTARVFVAEGIHYDNWDGGTYGHDVRLYLPLETLAKISAKEQGKLTEALTSELRAIAPQVPNEFINGVQFEMNDEGDVDFQQSTLLLWNRPALIPEALKIWQPGLIRVFISHRDQQKIQARDLASELEAYGFSCFVAHDTIAPMAEWRLEIMRGLETMEVMLAFVTDDFSASSWTNQEVGYALGAGKPVVGLKLGKEDPPGFIQHIQALKAKIDTPTDTAAKLYPILCEALGAKSRMQTGLVTAFANSPDWGETTKRFNRLHKTVESLADEELQTTIQAYNTNDQLHGAAYLTNHHNRLKIFLENTTGKNFDIQDKTISIIKQDNFDGIPF